MSEHGDSPHLLSPEHNTEPEAVAWHDQDGALFLSDAEVGQDDPEQFNTINLKALSATGDWDIYRTLSRAPLDARPEAKPARERALDPGTEAKLRDTFEALGTMELDAFGEGDLFVGDDDVLIGDGAEQTIVGALKERTDEELLQLHTLSGPLYAEATLLAADDELDDVLDPRMVTGLHMIEDGEDEDIEEILDPFSMTGFHLIEGEDEDEALEADDSSWAHDDKTISGQPAQLAQLMSANPGTQVIDLNDLEALSDEELSRYVDPDPGTTRQLKISLEALGPHLSAFRPPWGQYVAELRAELLAPWGPQERAAMAQLVSWLVRLHDEPTAALAEPLEAVSARALPVSRQQRLEALAHAWDGPFEALSAEVDRLRAYDAQAQTPLANLRHGAIWVSRLLDELVEGAPSQQLIDAVAHRESIAGLLAQALLAHRWGEHQVAAAFWYQLSLHLVAQERALFDAFAALLWADSPQLDELLFDEHGQLRPQLDELSLLIVQQRALKRGDLEAERHTLDLLLGDVPPEGAAAIWVAYRVRMAALLGQLHGPQAQATALAQTAAATPAPSPLLWSQVLVAAQRAGDLALEYTALTALQEAQTTRAPQAQASLAERVAWARYCQDHDEDALLDAQRRILQEYGASSSLAAVVGVGQALWRRQDWDALLELRGDDASPYIAAYRRAQLLELARGDWREILSLYRSARHERPDDPHLFFCVERALARQGQWRGLWQLFEAVRVERPLLFGLLSRARVDVESAQLAVELYLDDAPAPALARLQADYAQRLGRAQEGEIVDEAVFWRLLGAKIQARQIPEALEQVDALLVLAAHEREPRLRAQLWRIYLLGVAMRQPEQCVEAYRDLLLSAQGALLKRFAWHGLLRVGDFVWLAQRAALVASGDGEQALSALAGLWWGELEPRWLALSAELYLMAGQVDEALACWQQLGEEGAQRALGYALSHRDWPLVQRILPMMALQREGRQAYEGVTAQLNACRDEPLSLDALGVRASALATTPVHALSELECCLRIRSWDKALEIIDLACASTVERRGPYRAMLTMLAVLIARWGALDMPRAWRYLRQWTELAAEFGGEWEARAMLVVMYNVARSMGREEDAERAQRAMIQSFGAALGESILVEHEQWRGAGDEVGALVAWYQREAKAAGREDELGQHFAIMGTLLGWLFDERHAKLVQGMEELATKTPDMLQLLIWLMALAHREAGMMASMERALEELGAQIHVPELAQWAQLRELTHLAITLSCPEDALLAARAKPIDEAWLAVFCELLERATLGLRPQDVQDSSSRFAMATQSSSASMLVELADEGMAAAILWAELRAANERRDWRVGWNLELQHAGLRRSLGQEPLEQTRAALLNLLEASDPALIASPWCPLRLVDHDLMRLGIGYEQLDVLKSFAQRAAMVGVGAEVRLLIAQQLVRGAKALDAIALIPDVAQDSLVSSAWSWLVQALDADMRQARSASFLALEWARRHDACQGSLGATLGYERARAQAALGTDAANDQAFALYQQVLSQEPEFLPAFIAASRHLLVSQDWERLASLWEQRMESLRDVDELVALSMRLGLLYERRLGQRPDGASSALAAYERVLSLAPDHEQALLSALSLCYRLGRLERAAQLLTQLLAGLDDDSERAQRELELAGLYELELGQQRDAARALTHYLTASALLPKQMQGLLGVLRLEPVGGEHAARLLDAQLRRDVVAAATLDSHLLLRAMHDPQAAQVMAQRFGDRPLWRLWQLARSLSQGQIDEPSVRALGRLVQDEQLLSSLAHLELVYSPSLRSAERQDALGAALKAGPFSEGLWVSLAARGWRELELELLVALSRASAAAMHEPQAEALELLKGALVLRYAGDVPGAFELCQRALARYPGSLPGVKLARYLSAELADWASTARHAISEAKLSRIEASIISARLLASDVMRRHTHDLEGARAQLEQVLSVDAQHEEAYEQLRGLLLQQRAYPELIALGERRLALLKETPRKVQLLNELADLCLQGGAEDKATMRYLNMSLRLEPRQLRRLMTLAELYERSGQFEQAVVCYDAATQLAEDRALVVRLWLQIAHLLDERLGRLGDALKAYERVLSLEPHAEPALFALVRLYEQQGQGFKALEVLDRLAKLARGYEEQRRVRVAKLELMVRAGLPVEGIMRASKELLVYNPEHVMTSGILGQCLRNTNRLSELEPTLRQAIQESMAVHQTPPLVAFYAHAKYLGLKDLAFNLAACARWLGIADAELMGFHSQAQVITDARWPNKAIPAELTAGLLPQELVVSFVEVIRRSAPGLKAASNLGHLEQHMKRRARLSQPFNVASQQAMRWPTLFGFEVKEVYLAQERLPTGSGFMMDDDGVRLVIDEQWRLEPMRIKLLASLGSQLAGWSIGAGLWSVLPRETQQGLLLRMIHLSANRAPSPVNAPAWFDVDRFDKWLYSRGAEVLGPYIAELSGRLSPQQIPAQFVLLELAMERLGCVVLPDPFAYLTHTARFGVEAGPAHRPWVAALSLPVARLRHALGIAYE